MNILFELILFSLLFLGGSYSKIHSEKGRLSMQQTTLMRGIAIIMVYLQHTMGALGTNIFTPLGGGECAFS